MSVGLDQNVNLFKNLVTQKFGSQFDPETVAKQMMGLGPNASMNEALDVMLRTGKISQTDYHNILSRLNR